MTDINVYLLSIQLALIILRELFTLNPTLATGVKTLIIPASWGENWASETQDTHLSEWLTRDLNSGPSSIDHIDPPRSQVLSLL